MNVLVTGAAGFLGSHIAAHLHANSVRVLGLVRPSSETSYLQEQGIQLRCGDMQDTESLRRAVERIDVVIHCAGLTRARQEQDFIRINAVATQQLAEYALQAGVQRFVYISSLAAHGPSETPRAEEEPIAPVSSYGRSKRDAELRLLSMQDRLHIVILRPPIIYGPRFLDFLPLFQAAQKGIVAVPTDGQGKLSAIGAADCAAAVRLLVQSEFSTGSVFSLSDGQVYSMRQLGELAAEVLEKRVRYVNIPMFVLQGAARVSTFFGRFSQKPPFFNIDKLEEIRARHWVCGHAALTKTTGWYPRQTLHEGMQEMLLWYKEQKLL